MGPILYVINVNSPFYSYYNLNDGLGLFALDNCCWYIFIGMIQQGKQNST